MLKYSLVAVGGALRAVLRYAALGLVQTTGNAIFPWGILVLITMLLSPCRDDTIVFVNGDRLVGRVKEVANGRMSFSPSSTTAVRSGGTERGGVIAGTTSLRPVSRST